MLLEQLYKSRQAHLMQGSFSPHPWAGHVNGCAMYAAHTGTRIIKAPKILGEAEILEKYYYF